jgi:hypothetical protein
MIRSKTTLIVGAGASSELGLPNGVELLSRVAQGFDFSRLGTELQTKDSVILGQYLGKLGTRLGKNEAAIREAAERIRIACKLCSSIDSLIEQYGDDQLIAASGKLAIVHFICQAEARSVLRLTPRVAGDLPVQGADNWLFQLAQLVTSGVSKSRIAQCFDDLTIISFNYDRSIEHFMPHALVMAYGMELGEAQKLVGSKLRVIHPYGSVGRLPWQVGDTPDVEWGTEQPWNIHNLAMGIRTASEVQRDQNTLRMIRAAVSGAKRIVFLGFGFQPQNVDLLMDYGLSHDPDVMASVWDQTPLMRDMILRMLRRKTGIENPDLIMMIQQRAFEILRDFSLLLES